MPNASHFTTWDLRRAALECIEKAGCKLERKPDTPGQLYHTPDGSRVRLRTSNDRRLLVTTDGPDSEAKTDFDDADYILLAMPRVARADGEIDVYFIPKQAAQDAVQQSHRDWLATLPRTNGENCTWFLAFYPQHPPSCGGYDEKWRIFKL